MNVAVEVWKQWEADDELAAIEDQNPQLRRRHCVNCRQEKALRPSGRCMACEKHFQRHTEERPFRLIEKELVRRWADEHSD